MSIGERVRHYRRLKDMTQEELAIQVGYQAKASINKIEKNMATVPHDRLVKIASALGVSTSDLCDENKEVRVEIPAETLELQKLVNAYCNASEEGKAIFMLLADKYLKGGFNVRA